MKKKSSYKDTFKKWNEENKPYFTHDREGTEVKAKRFKIYEDEKTKVCRVEEPTFFSEYENTIQVQIKNPFILFDMAIGGCITAEEAKRNAQLIISKLVK